MSSNVQICNLANAKLGQNPITSLLDPETAQEQLCASMYDPVRRSVLNEVDWSFARYRSVITAQVAEEPNWGFTYAIATPSDLIRIIKVEAGSGGSIIEYPEWDLQGGLILSNYPELYITYTREATVTSQFSPLFVDMLATRLAYEMCIAITQNVKLYGALMAEYAAKLQKAAVMDGMQGSKEQITVPKLRGVRNRPAQRGGVL